MINFRQLLKAIDGTLCGVIQIYHHFDTGYDVTNTTGWIGSEKLKEILHANVTELNAFSDFTILAKANFDLYENEFDTEISNAYNKHKDSTLLLINPNNLNDDSIVPEYISNYGPILNGQTDLWSISKEYKDNLGGVRTYYQQRQEDFSDNITMIQQITSGLNLTHQIINAIDTELENYEKNLVSVIFTVMDTVGRTSTIIFYIMFAFTILLLLLGLTLVTLHLYKKMSLSVLLNLVWIFFGFFVVIYLILGGVMGLVGTITLDAGIAVQHILSTTNLESATPLLFPDPGSAKLVNTCINSNIILIF